MSGSGTATGRRKRDDMDNCKGCKLNDDGCKQMGEKVCFFFNTSKFTTNQASQLILCSTYIQSFTI